MATMSTPPKRDAKAAAKRRADARRRNREIGRHLFAYGIVAILVIGTISTVLVQPATAPTNTTPVVSIPTQPQNTGLEQLITQADQEVAASNWVTATGLYRAYVQANPSAGADVHFKLGRAIVNSPSPNYLEAATSLQRAIDLGGQGSATASDAQALLTQIQPQVSAAATAAALATALATATPTSGAAITATTTLTSTNVPLATQSVTGTPTTLSTVEPVGPVLATATPTPRKTPAP